MPNPYGDSAPARRVGAKSAPVNPTGLRILSGFNVAHWPGIDYHGPMTKKPAKTSHGHLPHMTGGGIHGDRRTKRMRTRSAQKRFAIKEW